VPLDFSPASFKALKYACVLVRTCGAQLHLVHVCDYDSAPSLDAIGLTVPKADCTRRLKRRLQHVAARYQVAPSAGNLHLVHGRAYHEICRLAGRLDTDLIVTSTRGHTGFKHVILGSTAERVVQHARCPVLIVREHEHDILQSEEESGPALKLRRILVPLDFSQCSLIGLEYAVPWAHFWKAQLVLFHSAPVTNFTPYGEFGADGIPMMDAYVEDAAKSSLREIASGMLERGVAVETVVEAGPPASRVCEYAERHEIDLIITSTHGSTGFVHAVIGSTAEHIVRYARCPVLVVPTRKKKGARS
jgi:nucleotide-binding universal stress UspA family protein